MKVSREHFSSALWHFKAASKLALAICGAISVGGFSFDALAVEKDSLQNLLRDSLQSHPSIQAAALRQQAAEADIRTARWQFYPTPSISFEHASHQHAENRFQSDDSLGLVGLTQPLWTGGRLRAGLARAEAEAQASAADLARNQQAVALNVIQEYGVWLAAVLKGQAWKKSLATHRELHAQVSRRVEQGVSAVSDQLLSEARLNAAQASLGIAESEERVALFKLMELARRPVDSTVLFQQKAQAVDLSGVEVLQAQGVESGPGVREARANIAIATATSKATRAERSPELFFRAEYQQGDSSIASAPAGLRYVLGLQTRFGAGLSVFSKETALKLQEKAAAADLAHEIQSIKAQIASHYQVLGSLNARARLLGEALRISHQVSSSYKRQFLAGGRTWIDVMNAARDQVSVEVQLAEAESARIAISWRLAIMAGYDVTAVAHD